MRNILALILFILPLTSLVNGQNNGTSLFDETYVHNIELTFDNPSFWDTLQAHYDEMMGNFFFPGTGIKKYIPATCTIDGVSLDSVGVRQKGNFSNWGASGVKKPLKLDFNEFVAGQKYDGLKKLNLSNGFQDPSMLRDALSYKMMREFGVPAPRTSFAKVYLNGTYWGLYVLVEQINKDFLKNNFPNNDGNLFKCIENTDLLWQGTTPASYDDEFELKTNETINDWTQFIDLVDAINNSTNSTFKSNLEERFNVENYINALALDVLLYNWDSYYDHGRNFYIYHDSITNQFNWIPWDYNLSFSDREVDIMLTEITGTGGLLGGPTEKPLNENILNNAELKEQYFSAFCNARKYVFNLDAQEDYIDNVSSLIRSDLDADPNKFYDISEFDTNTETDIYVASTDLLGFPTTDTIPGIKSFIEQRHDGIASEIFNEGFECSKLVSQLMHKSNEETVVVYPNPASESIRIELQENKGSEISLHNALGDEVYKNHLLKGMNYTQINVTNLPSGLYILTVGDQKNKVIVN